MSEHTPGPWTFHANRNANNYHIRAGDDWPIAILHNGESLGSTQEANLRLMVAAPELLAALKDLYQIAVAEGVVGDNTTLEAAAAAISKAEGKS